MGQLLHIRASAAAALRRLARLASVDQVMGTAHAMGAGGHRTRRDANAVVVGGLPKDHGSGSWISDLADGPCVLACAHPCASDRGISSASVGRSTHHKPLALPDFSVACGCVFRMGAAGLWGRGPDT